MIFSLKKKTLILLTLFSLLFGGTALFLSSYIINDIVDADYKSKVTHLATSTAHQINGDKAAKIQKKVMKIYRHTENKVGSDEWGSPEFEDYIDRFDEVTKMKEFSELHDQLEKIQDDNEVSSVYLLYVDKDTRNGVYLVDAAHEDPCPPGCFDPIYEVNYDSLENPERGYPPYITDTEPYGWLITCAVAVKDSTGEVVCYAAVDASMMEIRGKQRKYFYLTTAVFLVVIVLITLVGYAVINRYIVKPIRELSNAARKYCESDTKTAKIGFSRIVVSSHDEIRELADSMKQMEYYLKEYISNLIRTREQLVVTRERAEVMSEMANKDSLTGLRNKRAYEVDIVRLTQEIHDGYARFGIVMVDMNYLKRMNDNFGHEKGDIAIQKLSRMICDAFKHSPVYRFGGDEFVVIVENQDYRDVNDLVRQFKSFVEKTGQNQYLEEWERVSAAIGFAIYDEHRDKSVEDVFQRADDAMYANKSKMKGGNPEER